MLGAARVSVRFCCPGCGAGLRAPCTEAGTAIGCHRCGEGVRVPHRPHPFESDVDDPPLIAVNAVTAARLGARYLQLSLALFLIEWSLAAVAIGYCVSELGPARVVERDFGDLRAFLMTIWVVDLALVTGRTWLRWVGYRRCEPAAAAVRAAGWVTAARFAVLLRWVGYATACTPLILGLPPRETRGVIEAFVTIGRVTWLAGALLEFGVLFAWVGILTETSGREAAYRVARYTLWAAFAVVAVSGGVCLTGVAVVLLARHEIPPPPARLTLSALPDDAWYVVAGLLVFCAVTGLVLCWKYARVLAALRVGMTERAEW